jgi:probable HAF family extracellular repeat protein
MGLHAFLYSNGQMIDLGTFGGKYSSGAGVNNAGDVTGAADTPTDASHAFLYSNGQLIDLGTLGGRSSGGSDINQAGEIVGSSETVAGPRHAFLYSNGQMIDLGTLGGAYINSAAGAINTWDRSWGIPRHPAPILMRFFTATGKCGTWEAWAATVTRAQLTMPGK